MLFPSWLQNRSTVGPHSHKPETAAQRKRAFRRFFVEQLEERCQPSTASAFVNLPLSFEANVGQVDAAVRYLAHGSGYSLALTDTGAVLDLHRADAAGYDALLHMELVGGSTAAPVVGLDQQAGHSNYLIGNDPSRWHTDVPLFGRVEYQQVYPGIDVVFYGNDQHQLEYDFVLAAGADPGQIGLRFDGAQGLTVDSQGDLVLHLAGGNVVQQAPVVYQEVGGVRSPVPGTYVVHGDGTVGVTLGHYDATQALVVDPVLTYAAYFGGRGADHGNGIAVDGAGNAYVTGETESLNFPTTAGALETGPNTSNVNFAHGAAFVAKLNAAGNALVYSTYLDDDGSNFQRGPIGYAISVDSTGNAYVTGDTGDGTFPTTSSVDPTLFTGAFVAKLNPAGNSLVYSTIVSNGQGRGIAVDGNGNAYVCDVFGTETKLNALGSALVYSTSLRNGTPGDLTPLGIAVDGAGNAYVTGETNEAGLGTAGAFQTNLAGGFPIFHAFVAKLNAAGGLAYFTYLGGNGQNTGSSNPLQDLGSGIAVDRAGNAYVTGQTRSWDFPYTVSAYQTSHVGDIGSYDAFMTKLNADGSALLYSTYLGGGSDDDGTAIALDAAGNAYVTGTTTSINFPTANPVQIAPAEAFVAKLDPSQSGPASLIYSTFLGGLQTSASAIAVDGAGNAYVTGGMVAGDFPMANPLQAPGGGEEAFVAKLPAFDPFTYTTPQDSAIHMLTLRRNGANLELIDNGTVVRSRIYAITTGVSITAATLSPAPLFAPLPAFLSIDNTFGGLIELAINFGSASLQSPLTITTTSAADTLTLAPGKATLDTTQVVTFNVPGVTVNGKAGDTAVLTGGPGPETFAVTPTQATVTGAGVYTVKGFGTVTADGQGGGDTLSVDDSAATGPVTCDLFYNSVTCSGLATILYSGMTSVELDGGSGGNTIHVISTASGTATTIQPGTGPNTIDLGLVGFLHGDVTVNGQGSNTALFVDDSGFYGPVTYDLDSSTVRRFGGGTVHYSAITTLEIDGSKGGNTVHATSIAAGTPTTVNGGSGQNTFTGSFSGSFDGTLALTGFQAATLDVAGSFSGSLLAASVGTTAQPIQEITVGGSVAATGTIKVGVLSSLTVNGSLAGTVKGFGDPGNTSTAAIGTITIGGSILSGGSITAPVLGTVSFAGTDAGAIRESSPTQDLQKLTIGGSFTSSAVVSAASIAAMTVGQDLAGQVAVAGALTTLDVTGTLSGTVFAGTLGSLTVGQDLTGTVTVSQSLGNLVVGGSLVGDVGSQTITSALINGTANDDTFVISPTAVTLNGSTILTGTYAALTVNGLAGNDLFVLAGSNMPATLNGGAGNDTFQFNDGASITGAIDGGPGFNTLDYRAYTTPASVDLGTGQATGVTGGVQNIENVLGATVRITVISTADSGPGSLRQAILAANAHPGHDTITFHIPASGVQTIAPLSPLPDITDPVTINGYSQPGASANTLAVGDNAVLLIQLDGSNAGLGANGLHITAGSSTVQGLDITHFMETGAPTYQGGVGILLDTNGGNVIQGNFIGADPTGTLAMGNVEGVNALQGAFANTIGGTTPAARNLISGNINGFLDASGATMPSQGNVIEGNYVGTNAAGNAPLPNTEDGVDPGSFDTVGGTGVGADNVISGNRRAGMVFFGSNIVVQGNLIGTDATGAFAIGNNFGILAFQTVGNLIGGSTAARNVVSGNILGIELAGNFAHDNVVQGNYIGTNAAGTTAVGNLYDGILIAFASNNTFAGNVISGNGLDGIELASGSGFDATDNLVQGNFIGTDAAGMSAIGNARDGIRIYNGAHDNQIGAPPSGSVAGLGNTIAFNGGAGVAILDAGTIDNSTRGNTIHDNGGLGIDLGDDGVTANGPPPRTGPNNLQNYPTLQVAGLVAGGTGVVGSLDSLPNTAYTIDFYASAAADPSGYGQGQTYLGSALVTTNSASHATFAPLLPAVAPGSVITATATDAAGNTSEFAADLALQPLADLDVSAAGVLTYTASPGIANNVTISLAGGVYTVTDTSERLFVTGANAGACTGTGTNTVTCSAAGITAIVANTGDGNDTLHVASALGSIPVSLDGGSGTNSLVGPDLVNSWRLTGLNQGTLNGNVAFQNFVTLVGGALADTFAFAAGGRLDGTLDGGGGVNTLDYSAYTGDITVDLALQLGTLVAGGGAGYVRNMANVTGSIGNDLLVGDANANVFVGGTGRNILIGGAGADSLTGGGGDNLLLGGTTAYDTNLTALQAIMSEWTRSGYSFHQRVDHLMNGTGLNGSYVLNADPTLGPVTVFDDGFADVLTGGGGASWFLYHKANDTIKNRKPGDFQTLL
jgi:parallel beta-helix repeat protein